MDEISLSAFSGIRQIIGADKHLLTPLVRKIDGICAEQVARIEREDAAAPALLEACKEAVATLANGDNPPSRRMEWASETLRAAIAQATGQEVRP